MDAETGHIHSVAVTRTVLVVLYAVFERGDTLNAHQVGQRFQVVAFAAGCLASQHRRGRATVRGGAPPMHWGNAPYRR